MNDTKPLYNSRIIKVYLDYLRKYYPDLDTELLLNASGMTPYEAEDQAHWFTQTQIERFQKKIVEQTGNEHIARDAGQKINDMYHGELTVNMDVLIAGAILADVGKLLEYELDENGNAVQGNYGKYVRHPFSGVSLAEEAGVPAEVCHIIAAHAGEGNMIKRTTEAYVVHHADFMTFLPFKERLKI